MDFYINNKNNKNFFYKNDYLIYLYEDFININNILDINFLNFYIKINNIDELKLIQYNIYFSKIENIIFNINLINNEEFSFFYFIDKKCWVEDNNFNENIYNSLLLNPLVYGIINVKSIFNNLINNNKLKLIINDKSDIENFICHININKIAKYLNIEFDNEIIINKIISLINNFYIYNIFNLPDNLNTYKIDMFYKNIFNKIGILTIQHPVNNDINTTKQLQRDIKYDKNAKTLHFYNSNNRQPLHNDFAYYPYEYRPDLLLLYSLEQSEYGGITSFITVKTLKNIIYKYNNDLYTKLDTFINYKYIDNDISEIIIHKKKIIDIEKNEINWNYFQIYNELNDIETLNFKEDFFIFLEKYITDGNITDINKKWSRGDAIIINDSNVLHQRSSFLGNRHLKDISVKLFKK
jgi:hypothetical protein